eukprot:CAMPEP_0203945516 /NCGR_PEP_ID=MMETSP0359-20131031/81024_1 /ASSEMBLY_ACC=CAM_ASM_000338 /TAXON_ID=268821 /ORGANISM="Scrippsiella Hangoei, Strain SHTV-5" /LENGTH=450 /DNA_ID=CAMNT_0050876695 /DNA_START=1 /DNA_END=1350 /DNA_ORIENTATION=+
MGALVSFNCCCCNGDAELWDEAAFGRKSVILVHGLASCALQTKVAPSTYRGCALPCSNAVGWDLTWLSIEEVITGAQRFRNVLELRNVMGVRKDGTPVLSTGNLEGVSVRPYPGLEGIARLNPGELIEVPVWLPLIEAMAPVYRLTPGSYDWRRWGDVVYMEECVEALRAKVEQEHRVTGRLVSIFGHSMGNSLVIYVLSVLGTEWTREHISELVLVAPAVMGSPKQVSAYAHNPASTVAGLPNGMSLPAPVEDFLRRCMDTAPSMASLLPMRVGGVSCFPAHHVFVKTPSRSYMIDDMGHYVQDLQQRLPAGRVPTAKFWPMIQEEFHKIKAPAVPTHIFYGSEHATVSQVTFRSDDLLATPEVSATAPGDLTVTAASIEALAASWAKQGRAPVHLHMGPRNKDCQEHLGMLKSEWFCRHALAVIEPARRGATDIVHIDGEAAIMLRGT